MLLPVEIVDHVLSLLQSDLEALRMCAECHPLLSQLAERYIFGSISLSAFDSLSNASTTTRLDHLDLANLLSERPHIVRYIHRLDIQTSLCHRWPNTELDEFHCLDAVSPFLPALSALREITLASRVFSNVEWTMLPESFRLSFLRCICMPSMQAVTVRYVANFPFRNLLNSEGDVFRNFTLDGCTSTGDVHLIPADMERILPSDTKSLPFETLTLNAPSDGLVEAFISFGTTFGLRLKSLQYHAYRYDSLQRLMNSFSKTLNSLSFFLGSDLAHCYSFDDPPVVYEPSVGVLGISLSALPHLENLTIRSALTYQDVEGHADHPVFFSSLPSITALLSDNCPSLKVLILDFICPLNSQTPPGRSAVPSLEVFCYPLIRLLTMLESQSHSSASGSMIHLTLRIHGSLTARDNFPLDILLPPDCPELKRFVNLNLLSIFLMDSVTVAGPKGNTAEP